MITQIFGVLIEKNPPFIVVDVNGIGYEISVPMSSYYLLPEINQKIKLLTDKKIKWITILFSILLISFK